jgi:hypothetical protein
MGASRSRGRTIRCPIKARASRYPRNAFQLSLFAILQPHRYASEAAYSTAAGLLISPQPRVHVGTTLRYSF